MTTAWKYPVAVPLLTDALVAELRDEYRPQAFDTRLRFSDAGGCTRALAYAALGAEREQMDAAGIWVTNLGTGIHALAQEAIGRRYPGARFEVKGIVGESSGHCDALINHDGRLILFELKTVGSFAFDKAIGLKRMKYQMQAPEGPRRSAILQAGLNALAQRATTVIVGYLAMEAVSIALAEKVGMRQMDRVMAEWEIPEAVWRPLAEEEAARQEAVLRLVDLGTLPVATAPDDDGSTVELDPAAQKMPWQCAYCRYRATCLVDGPGAVPIEIRAAS